MLAKRIIPCLDVNAGRVVKGVNFVSLRDAGDPVEVARRYDEQGADEVTFLDITASSDERDTILHIVRTSGGLQDARETARAEAQRAIHAAQALPANAYQEALVQLGASLLERRS